MARIRIVDSWLRSPVGQPVNQRAVLVVASTWTEQRVLLRAFQTSADQTNPTIALHGVELPISPAGLDSASHWGIHVEGQPDGFAQEVRRKFETAARRTKIRLSDEEPRDEGEPTSVWVPNTSKIPPRRRRRSTGAIPGFQGPAAPHWQDPNRRTLHGFANSRDPLPQRATHQRSTGSLAGAVAQTLPLGTALSETERKILEALGAHRELSFAQLSEITGHGEDVHEMMRLFSERLAGWGVDVVAVDEDGDGQPTFRLAKQP